MKTNRSFLPVLLFLVISACTVVILASAASGGELFVDLPQGLALPQDGNSRSSEVIRTRFTGVNLTAAERMRAGDSLTLTLFDDAVFTFNADSTNQQGNILTVTGHIQESADSLVVITVSSDQLVMDVLMGVEIYQVRSEGNNIYAVSQIDQSVYPEELPPVEVTNEMLADKPILQAAPQITADDGSQIDVLVIYTAAARSAAGGVTAIQNIITSAKDVTNASYSNSGVTHRINLVGMSETAYVESGDMGLDLSRLREPADGFMDNIHTLREQYKADLVNLIVESGQYCGIAYQMQTVDTSFASWAFSVVARSCAVGNLSFAHELGHTMGARHDWYVDNGIQPYTYSHGHINFPARWRTIMSYNNYCSDQGFNCTRIPYWSNPGITYAGAPLGISEFTCTGSVGCDADNARTLNNTAYTVANFRVGITPTPTPTRTRTPTPTITPTPTRTPTPSPTPPYKVLLVDDIGDPPEVLGYYATPLATLKATVTVWDTGATGNSEPNASQMSPYEALIWYTGDNYSASTGPSDTTELQLAAWLQAGGCLLISSQDYPYAQAGAFPNPFMQNYLGVASIVEDKNQTSVTGKGSAYGGFGPYILVTPPGFAGNYTDVINPSKNAEIAFQGNQGSGGVSFRSDSFKTTYWGFPLEMISNEVNRTALLKRFLHWCRYYDSFLPLISR